MTNSTRLLAAFAVVAAAAAVVGWARQASPSALHPQSQQESPIESSTAPLPQCRIVIARVHSRLHLVRQLGAKQVTLFEAAAQFRRLNTTPAEFPQNAWKNLPGRCDNEKVCHQVLNWCRVHLPDTLPVSAVESTVCELEHELNRHITRHGKVILPGD